MLSVKFTVNLNSTSNEVLATDLTQGTSKVIEALFRSNLKHDEDGITVKFDVITSD